MQRLIRASAQRLSGDPGELEPLLRSIGEARIVLIGEATHGSHEFYRCRAEITERLIAEKGFQAVAVEADWPDAARVNAFVRSRSGDADASQALGAFERFPRWMWRNAEVRNFVSWLREFNRRAEHPVGFYGLDLYSLHRSIAAVLEYLERVDPEAARLARQRYSCFDHQGDDPHRYGQGAALGAIKSCEDAVVAQLTEMQRRAGALALAEGRGEKDEFFSAEQNARLIRNAERYYRAMFAGSVASWNLRDQHMAATLNNLLTHLGTAAKVVVWAHNSHVGDARATDMAARNQQTLGQIARMRYGREAYLIGFTTYTGTVRAADDWDEPDRIKRVRPALPDSYELLLHEAAGPDLLLTFGDKPVLANRLSEPRLERAIGVIYRPETERQSHYFFARLADQFDAVIHFDSTHAVVGLGAPAEETAGAGVREAPETYPTGI